MSDKKMNTGPTPKTIWVIHLDYHGGGGSAYTASTKERAEEIRRELACQCEGTLPDDTEWTTDELVDEAAEHGDYITVYETTLDEGVDLDEAGA